MAQRCCWLKFQSGCCLPGMHPLATSHRCIAATPHLQAHEALKEAREALYRLQALAELLSRELQRRRSNAAASTGTAATARRRSSSDYGAAAAAAAAGGAGAAAGAGAATGGAASRGVQQIEERLLVPPATQGTKRKRGAPPEPCPFCGHCYTGDQGAAGSVWLALGRALCGGRCAALLLCALAGCSSAASQWYASNCCCCCSTHPTPIHVSLPLQCGMGCPTSWASLVPACTCGGASAAKRRRPASELAKAGHCCCVAAAPDRRVPHGCLCCKPVCCPVWHLQLVRGTQPLPPNAALLPFSLPSLCAGTAPTASSCRT